MSEDIWGQLSRSPKLPTPPRVALEVLRLAGSEKASVGEIAALIEKDAALTGRLLKTVNGAYYGVRRQVASVRQAAVLLGLRAVKLIALSFSLPDRKELAPSGLDYEAHWRRSLACGAFASRLARAVGYEAPDEAYVGGLLADIGVVVLARCVPTQYQPVLAEAARERVPLAQVEAARLGLTHAQVGRWLLDNWELPTVVCEAVGKHHDRRATGDPQGGTAEPLADLLHAADLAAAAMEDEDTRAAVEALRRFAVERLCSNPETVATCLGETEREVEETRWLLDLGPIRHTGCDELLRRAAEAKAQLSQSPVSTAPAT